MNKYMRLSVLARRMDALNHILTTEDDEEEKKDIEKELYEIRTEYNKLID